jgi:hypothetical protein
MPQGRVTEFLEDLLQPGNLSFGFMQIIAKAGSEFAIGRLLDQLWKAPLRFGFRRRKYPAACAGKDRPWI